LRPRNFYHYSEHKKKNKNKIEISSSNNISFMFLKLKKIILMTLCINLYQEITKTETKQKKVNFFILRTLNKLTSF
jgi:hypothetical protein